MKKLSRMEASKECRRILNRHGVDLSYCQYMCSGYEVRLYGKLMKIDGSDFNTHQIEAMIADFQKVLNGISVFGELENWTFSSENITYHGEGRQSNESQDSEQEIYVLELDDYDLKAS